MAAWEEAPLVTETPKPAWEGAALADEKPAWEAAPVVDEKPAENPPASLKEALTIEELGRDPTSPLAYAVGAGETAAQLGSGLFGTLAGTLAGTYESVRDLDPGKFAPAFQREAEPVTYQPRSEAGKSLSELLSLPFTAAEKLGEKAGEKTFEKTGSPLAATAAQTTVAGVPYVASFALGIRRGQKPSRVEETKLTEQLPEDAAGISAAREKLAAATVRESGSPEPIRAFHGTTEAFKKFSGERLGENTGAPSAEKGFFFTKDAKVAEAYATESEKQFKYKTQLELQDRIDEIKALEGEIHEGKRYGSNVSDLEARLKQLDSELRIEIEAAKIEGANIRPVDLYMNNPMIVDFGGKAKRVASYSDLIDQAKAKGHDSLIIKNTFDAPGEAGNILTDVFVVFNENQIKPGFGKQATKPQQSTPKISSAESALRDQLRAMSNETLDKVQKFLETDLSKIEIPKPGTDPKLNYVNYLVTAEDAKKALLATQDLTKLTSGRKTLEQVKQDALAEGRTVQDLLGPEGKELSAANLMTYKSVVAAAGRNLVNLREKAKTGTEAEKALFAAQFEETMAILDSFDGVKSEWGRAGRVLKEPISDEIARINAVRKLNEKTYKGHSINDILDMTDGMTTQGLLEFAKGARRATTSEKFLEAWKAGLLTGLRTHEANLSSNLIAQVFNLQEHVVAAGLGKILPRASREDRVFFREIPAQASGMVGGALDGAKLAMETLRRGETAADASKALDLTTRYQAIPGRLGTAVRTPYRVLAAEDKLFKEMAKQAQLHTLAARQAAATTKTGAEFKAAYDALLKEPTKEMLKSADDMALYMTFNKELGKTGKAIQVAISSHPAFSVIVPFVRTPTNVVKFAGERSPLAVLSQKVRAEYAKGGVARDLMLSKMIVGSAWAYAGYEMAANGMLTGNGPIEPGKRSVWLNTNKPYSIKVGDQFYAYNRFEPVGTFFGAAADINEVWKAAGTEERDKLAAMLASAISKNLTNKTMVAGISSAILAQTDPSRYGERFVNQLAGSVIPTIAAEVTQSRDPIYRQIDSTIDAIKARTPGLSETLYPKRDIYGNPIKRHGGGAEAFMVAPGQDVQTDLAYTELARLEVAIPPPERKILGQELDISVYDRYTRDAGELAYRMNSRIVNHPNYLGAPPLIQKELLEGSFREARKIARLHHGLEEMRVTTQLEKLRNEVRP